MAIPFSVLKAQLKAKIDGASNKEMTHAMSALRKNKCAIGDLRCLNPENYVESLFSSGYDKELKAVEYPVQNAFVDLYGDGNK